jgi:hypothetical protein
MYIVNHNNDFNLVIVLLNHGISFKITGVSPVLKVLSIIF